MTSLFDLARFARPLAILLLAGVTVAADCDDDDDDMMGPDPTPQTFMQLDRFGLPAINTVFIPTAQKKLSRGANRSMSRPAPRPARRYSTPSASV